MLFAFPELLRRRYLWVMDFAMGTNLLLPFCRVLGSQMNHGLTDAHTTRTMPVEQLPRISAPSTKTTSAGSAVMHSCKDVELAAALVAPDCVREPFRVGSVDGLEVGEDLLGLGDGG